MRPDVSVLMAVYNGIKNYPPNTLYGVLGWGKEAGASRADFDISVELCICDDASTDDSYTTIRSWTPGVGTRTRKWKRHDARRGPAAAYQTAAEMATGRYIILQSVRSWYEPGALKAMVDALDAHPEVGFVYGQTQYHGASKARNVPPPFRREQFWSNFVSLFGYMYRREALDAGCRYEHYITREGLNIDIADYDFIMQLIVNMGWDGLALPDLLALHYYHGGKGQMTRKVHKYQAEINAIFTERWGEACVSVG